MNADFKNILLTGASGQLGRRLLPRLIAWGYRMRAHYRSREKAARYCPAGAEMVIGDLRSPDWLSEAVRGCQAVIHAGARVSLRQGNYEEQYRVNVEGTKALISACRSSAVKRLVFISSIVTVGASENGRPIDETAPFNLGKYDIPYIKTKHEAEVLALTASGPSLEVISVNPSIMISPPDREVTRNDLRKIPRFLPAYFDFGLNVVETDDVIGGIIAALEKGRPGQRYLLTGENIDARRAFELAGKYLGLRKPFLKIPTSSLVFLSYLTAFADRLRGKRPKLYPDMARMGRYRFFYSFEKAKRELGYNPRPLEETLGKILGKMKTQGGDRDGA
jgi:dihydroflavonol-4-reductase